MKSILIIALIVLSAQAAKLNDMTEFFEGFQEESGLDLSGVINCLNEKNSKKIYNLLTDATESQSKTIDEFTACVNDSNFNVSLVDWMKDNEIEPQQYEELRQDSTAMESIAQAFSDDFFDENYFKAGKDAARAFLDQLPSF